MATKIISAPLKVTVTESITLNGTQQGAVNTKTITAIGEISKRIITITTA